MKRILIEVRNSIFYLFYKFFLRPFLFLFNPEKVHDCFVVMGRFLGSNFVTEGLVSFVFSYSNDKLRQKICGIDFKNPVGLAAGFDKDAKMVRVMPCVGFGYEEVGSITAKSYAGNKGVRLWRLKRSKALVVNYGLKNDGADVIYKRLKGKKFGFPVGINIAKTNSRETVDIDKGIADYVYSYKKFGDVGDYFTINISCPNAYGGEPFTDVKSLEKLLKAISKFEKSKPIFLKISPELSNAEVDEIITVARKYEIDGFVIANLVKDRSNKMILEKKVPKVGGISGLPCRDFVDMMIAYVYRKTKGEFVIIGCGGIFSAKDAYKKIKLGASLLQLITGMIYEGPQLISDINSGLVELMEKDGFRNISEVVGSGVKGRL